jgi:arabinan endo-1,5-alpha-L-arabinosidase
MSVALLFFSLVCRLSLFLGQAAGYANPGACSGVCNNSHDPAVIRRSDGTYFRFSTGAKIAVHTAPSISGPWSFRGAALPGGSKINLKGRNDLWAPDVTKIGNRYYLLYSVSSFGSQQSEIGHASSPTMDPGSWKDHGSSGVASSKGKPYNAIDGNLIHDDGGQLHMAFGSFWQDLYIASMSGGESGLRKTGGDKQIAFQPSGEHAVEAAYIYKHDNTYWLIFSAGKCCGLDKKRPAKGAEYKIMACKSTKGPEGPYVDKSGKRCTEGGGTTLLPSHDWVYAPGGQGVYTDPQHGPVLYYHYGRLSRPSNQNVSKLTKFR